MATYGPGGRFTMTDRGISALETSRDTFRVGPSQLRWRTGRLEIDVNEVSSLPLVSRIKGRITLTPSAMTDRELALTDDGAHIWRPFAPASRISVELNRGWSWEGHGYFDANFGTRSLEEDFDYWTWGRFPTADGALCLYDADRRDGSRLSAALSFDGSAVSRLDDGGARTRFARSKWLVRRETRADDGYTPRQVKSMLDAPFYCRSVVRTKLGGTETEGVHEALDLTRFRGPWLMPMLAVRVPRRSRWPGLSRS